MLKFVAPPAMSELQPLYDTGGAGLSLLDTILHTRVSADGIVSRTVSRLLYVCQYAAGIRPQELCEQQAQLLSEADPEATGFLLVQPLSMWGLVETSPEAVAALLRWAVARQAPGIAQLRSCRIVAQIEDCPSREFGSWCYRSVVLPPEPGVINVDAQSPVAASAHLYSVAMQIGGAVRASGAAVRARTSLPLEGRSWSRCAAM